MNKKCEVAEMLRILTDISSVKSYFLLVLGILEKSPCHHQKINVLYTNPARGEWTHNILD